MSIIKILLVIDYLKYINDQYCIDIKYTRLAVILIHILIWMISLYYIIKT